MLGYILIAAGALAMLLGTLTLWQWNTGAGRWFDPGVADRPGDTKNDRQFLDLYFISLIVAPLLGGAILIVFGLKELYT